VKNCNPSKAIYLQGQASHNCVKPFSHLQYTEE